MNSDEQQTPPGGFTVNDRRRGHALPIDVDRVYGHLAAGEACVDPALDDGTGKTCEPQACPPELSATLHVGPGPTGPDDPVFTAVVEDLQRHYRPGVPDDQVPPYELPPRDPGAAPQRPLYVAACSTCSNDGQNLGEPPSMAVPFGTEADRDQWATVHAQVRGHVVTLAEQTPETGTTITGYVHPPGIPTEPPPPARGVARAAAPPLVAFIVREGQEPDMLCRVPNRAGAAWMLIAAHACLLGRGGSLGIAEPHRVIYVGRAARNTQGDLDAWVIRIDGLLGATSPAFGGPVGAVYGVTGTATIPDVEETVEAMISDDYAIPRNLFSLVIVTDGPVAEPPDADADAYLREQRQAARATYREHGGQPVDAVREFATAGGQGPVAEVDGTAPPAGG